MRKFPSGDARKMSLYFPQEMADHISAHAVRLDRSKSWVVQKCVELCQKQIAEMLAPPEMDEEWLNARAAAKAVEAAKKAEQDVKAPPVGTGL